METIESNGINQSAALIMSTGAFAGSANTNVGTYTGNGTTQKIEVGFEPDFLIIVPAGATYPPTFLNHSTWNGRMAQFAPTSANGGPTRPAGPIFVEGGFTIGNSPWVNESTKSFYWFAYRDNGTESMLESDYRGNASFDAPRTVDLFKGADLRAVWFKRDNDPAIVHSLRGYGATDYVGADTTALINDDGTISIGQQANVNTGESCTIVGFPNGAQDTYVATYVGNSTSRVLALPWEPDALVVMPITAAAVRGGLWVSGMGGTYKPMGQSAPLSTGLTSVDGQFVSIASSDNLNSSGVTYVCYAFRRARGAAVPQGVRGLKSKRTVVTSTSGYIDCGTSDTLKISGALTLEWFGWHNQTDTSVFVGPNYNDEAGKQSPLMFRSNGADAVMGSISFGLASMAPWPGSWTAGVSMPFPSVTWAQSPIWRIWDGSFSQTQAPIMSGVGVGARELHHYVLTHNGHGWWYLYLDGKLVKECKDDLSLDPASGGVPASNIVGGTGHRMLFGARKRAGTNPEQANTIGMKLARIYDRALTPAEALTNWEALAYGGPSATSGFVEEWDADNAYGTLMPATVNAVNNGTIVNGSVTGTLPLLPTFDYDLSSAVLPGALTLTRTGVATRVNSAGQIETVATNQPRWDYSPLTKVLRGLLVERSLTNNALYSQDFSNAVWVASGGVMTANAALAPDGTTTAGLFTVSTGGSSTTHQVQASSRAYVSGTTYNNAVWVQKVDQRYVQLTLSSGIFGSAQWANFDFDTKTFTSINGLASTPTAEEFDNGWFLLRYAAVAAAAGSASLFILAVDSGTAGRLAAFVGAGTAFRLWGRYDVNGSVLGTYVPTTSTAVNRGEDVLSFAIPAGVTRVRLTYDDNATQNFVVSTGTYTLATSTLIRFRVKRIQGYAY